ncbi:MAG: peptidoglycan recognition protein family protein [Thermoleophilaceae bacterium]
MPKQIAYSVAHFTRGRRRSVNILVFHTTEGARTVQSLGAFLRRLGTASYHSATDDHSLANYVHPDNTAWHCRGCNPASEGFCFCAFSRWSVNEWLNHPVMLENAAWWLAQRSQVRGIPLVKLDAAGVRRALRNPEDPGGVCMHHTYTLATGDGTHWDCGPSFWGKPLDGIIARAHELTRKVEDDMFDEQDRKQLNKIHGDLPWVDKHVADHGREGRKHTEDQMDSVKAYINKAMTNLGENLRPVLEGIDAKLGQIRDVLSKE